MTGAIAGATHLGAPVSRLSRWATSPALLWALVAVFLVEKQVFALVSIPSGQDITTLSFAFGGYIEGLLERGTFTSCEAGRCEYASRMPLLPLISAGLGLISRDMLMVTLMKNAALSAFFVAGVLFVRAHAGRLRGPVTLAANLGLLFAIASPNLTKHAGMPFYEEGYLVEMLLVYWLCLMVLLATVWDSDSDTAKAPVTGFFVLLGVLLFLMKETMFGLLVVTAVGTGLLIWREGRALFTPLSATLMVLGLSCLGAWVAYNSLSTGRIAIFTTFNGENRFHGANPTTAALYPDIAPDRIFDSERAVLRDGTVVEIPDLKRRQEFPTDKAWDAYYREKAANWIAGNPEAFRAYTLKKVHNFFLSIDKTPRSTYAVYQEPPTRMLRLYNTLVAGWLVWGRVVQFVFLGVVILVLVTGPWSGRFTAVGITLAALAYASPYLVGLNYERHIAPFLLLLASGTVFLLAERRTT